MPPKRKAAPRKTKAAAAAEAKAEAEAQAQAQAAEAQSAMDANEASEGTTQEEAVTVKTTTMTTETVITTTTVITTEEEAEEDINSNKNKKKELQESKEKPEKKTSRSKRKAKDEEEVVEEEATTAATTAEAQQAPVMSNDQDQEMKEVEASSSSSSSSSAAKTTGAALSMAERMEKLKGLRQKMNASKQANRTDLMAEHQKSKINHREEAKKARAREAAEEMIAKQEAEEAGEDYERSQFWNYSAESVERWNEKQEAKRVRMDNKFTDWDQMNHKKYLKQVGELKPNLAAYNAKKEAAMHVNEDGELVVASDSGFYRDANSVAFLSDAKPNALAVDRLAADVVKQIEARAKFSKRRAHKEDEDVNYINDANQRFNQKIARFYDKHTKEIRDDFERGTAFTATKDEKNMKLGHAKGNTSGSDNTSDESGSDEEEVESDVYEVEKVVGHRRETGGSLSYHIKWKGYSDEESTWEHQSSVFCEDMVQDYWKQYIDHGGKKTDPIGDLKRHASSSLSLGEKRKSITSSISTSKSSTAGLGNNKHGVKSGKTASGKGGAGGRSGRIGSEPLLPDLSPLVKSSSAAALTATTGSAQGGTQLTSSKRARTKSPERPQSTSSSQAPAPMVPGSRRNSTAIVVSTSAIPAASSSLTTTSSTAKSTKATASESRKGISAAEQHKESAPRKLTALGPVLITEENWVPPSSWVTWDDYIERVEAIETRSVDRHDKSTMFVHLRWKNGSRLTLHPLSEIHVKAPHKLIEFYECHLQFQESNNARSE
ncbi:hypothetical protein BGZ95_000144 [Linnemannia exigua]|uniref:Pre-mRNA-splicing factor SYF2 n=1 Tax=Linnemannia exigua TaxID=604196 RepID=A0AAD4D8Q2_9FUNG|nr:hypothetical protein BGZ95_000144 [Linnemannia exigua]